MKIYRYNFGIRRLLCLLVFGLFLFSGQMLKAQNTPQEVEISGTIVDAVTGDPLFGARVAVAETVLSVITDENGSFKLKVPSISDVLIVSAPDYQLREIPVQGKTLFKVSLYSDHYLPHAGDVNTLTGKQRKSTRINPISTAEDFSLSPAVSIESEIQARLGGAVRTISRSGTPGIGSSLFIRGYNSMNANSQPLFIVDGVIWDNQLDNSSIHLGFFSNPLVNINVVDIESVSVLKDGNSLYGSKGANGVILINTVRGRDMTTRITANLSFGMNQSPKFPKMMNATQYRNYASNQVKGWLDYYNIYESNVDDLFPFLDDDPTATYYPIYHNDTDWSKEVYDEGFAQNYSLSVKGGDEIALYYFSMGYSKNEGTLRNTSLERLNARFNSDINLSSKMFAKVDVSISRTEQDMRDDGINSITSPGYISLIKAPILAPNRYLVSTGEFTPKLSDYDTLDPLMINNISNPLAIVENALGTSTRFGFDILANPYFKFTDNLVLGTLFNYRFNRVKESFFIPEAGVARQYLEGVGFFRNEVRDMAQRHNTIFSDTKLSWSLEPAPEHRLALLGGFRYQTSQFKSDIPRGYNTGNDNIKVLVSGLGYKLSSGESDQVKSMAWYANADYDFRKKYFLTLTASIDASSRFGENTREGIGLFGQRWGVFPSVGAAWLISSESFMKEVTFVDHLKLRASYGITGNDDISSFAGRSYFTSVKYIGQAVGLELANIRNDEIQWETSRKMNVGLDVHLLNERLALSVDLFNNTTDNLLTQKMLKSISGLNYYWANSGKLQNRGVEGTFDAKLLNLKNFKWELGATVAHYKNELKSLPEGSYETEILGGTKLTEVGQPVGVFYGYKTNGVFATTEEAEASGLYKLSESGARVYYRAGDVRFVDSDPNGEINEKDRQIIGDPNPDLYGTISSRFNVKKFTLDFLFNYSYGNDVYNYLRSKLESGAGLYNQTLAMTNRWTTEGQVTSMPRAVYGDPTGNNMFSDRWIEDGSYLRLKSVTLSYEIPIRHTYIQGLTIWASANNLLTWTNYLGSDPEFSLNNSVMYQGIDGGLTPQNRSYFIGVKMNL